MTIRSAVLSVLVAALAAACVAPSSSRRAAPVRSADPYGDARAATEEARALPLPPGNHRVDVERIWLSERDTSALGVAFSVTDESVVVSGGETVVAPGFRVGVVGPAGFAEVSGAWASARSAERTSLFLVTVPDAPASIVVGETRWPEPFVVPITPGLATIVVPGEQFVGSALDVVVSPRGEGLVQVSLTPVFTGLDDSGEVLRITELTTTVLVSLGHRLVVSSTDQFRDDVASTLFTRRTERGVEQGVITLTVGGG